MNPIFPESPQDWTKAKIDKIFYNSKNKIYTSTVLADEFLISEKDLLEKSRKYYTNFVKNVLANLNKEEQNIDDLIESVKLESNFIEPVPYTREKLLLSIPESSVKNLKEKSEKDTSSYEDLIYDSKTFFSKIKNVAEKFQDYQIQMVSNIFKKNNKEFYNIDFLTESGALYEISSNLSSLIESNNVDIEKYSQIQISYTSDYKIECIKLIDGIDLVEIKYLFEDFKKGYPQNRPRTVEFLYNISELNKEVHSSFTTYEDIINKYIQKEVNLRQNSANLRARSLNKGISSSVNNDDVSKKYESLKNISKKSVKILQQEILNSVYSTPCLTPEELNKINARLERESGKKANFANKFTLSVNDSFFNNLPEVLQKVADNQGKKALNDLGTNVLNRLGVCGVGDLVSLVINTVFAYLDEEEYADELSKCAVKNLDNDKLEKFWEGVDQFGKNIEILEKYRKIVGDTILPWTTGGYLPPDYRKGLRTDNPLDEKYTLKLPTSKQDTDIDFRLRAFKDSVAGTIDGRDLLNVLVNTFPDEMGWLSFFTDMTKGILNKCRVPQPGVNLSFEANWCQKRISLPKLQDLQKSNASFAFKPSSIATVLIEELKNVIINLVVSVIISGMQQIFEIISAGTSFDSDYFKQNQYIPDLFQSENDIQFRISSYCGDTSPQFRKTNQAVREIIYQNSGQTSQTNKLSLENVDIFLKKCSTSLSRYDKIRLYNGNAGPTTYDSVLNLVATDPISVFLKNHADVEQLFLSIAQLLDVQEVENNFYESVKQPVPFNISYCGEQDGSLDEGYYRNNPEITPEQVEKMKQTLKDIQKDKICFAAETMGNPRGVIIGQIAEMFESKTGPIFGRIAEEMGEIFKPTIENKIKTVSKNYKNDLYNAQGLFDLILVNSDGNGEVRRSFASFFGTAEKRPPIESMQNSRLTATSYSPFKSSTNVSIEFPSGSIDYLDQQRKLKLSEDKEIAASNKIEFGSFETGANKIQELLLKNQSLTRAGLNNKISDNFIRNGVLKDLVEIYFADMRTKLEKRTYGPNWYKIYDSIQDKESFISDILGEESIINDTKDLYGTMDNFDENYKYAPFNALKSKEEASLSYATFLLLVHTVTSEMLLKSLPIYEAFGAEMYHEFDLLGGYIYDKFIETIEEFTTDRGYIKTLEKLVQITIIASNQEIIPPLPSSISSNIDNLNQNIKKWIRGDRGNKVENLEKNEKDIEAVAKFFVKSTALKYIREFQKAMADVESNKFPSISLTNTISKYIFNQSVLGPAQDVVSDTENVGTDMIGLRLEKYIDLKGAKNGLPSGVQNLTDFQEYLKSKPSDVAGNISDNWSSWHFGLRISSVYEFSKAGISEGEISLDLRNQEKAFTLISDISESEPEKYFLSPLVVYEKEISDQPVSNKIIDEYDENSMKKGLSEIPDFLNFYYRGMNIENLMSLTTIYCNEEFSTFLTSGEPTPIGIFPRKTVENWISGGEKILNDTKRFIVNTLERI